MPQGHSMLGRFGTRTRVLQGAAWAGLGWAVLAENWAELPARYWPALAVRAAARRRLAPPAGRPQSSQPPRRPALLAGGYWAARFVAGAAPAAAGRIDHRVTATGNLAGGWLAG
jgi:hypothetical protein